MEINERHASRTDLPQAWTGEPEDRVSFFGEFEASGLEKSYLRESLHHDAGQAKVIVRVALLGTLLFISSDYKLFGATSKLVWVLIMRGVLVAASFIVLFILKRSTSPSVIVPALLWYSVIGAVMCSLLLSTRPAAYTSGNILVVLYIMAFYLAFPLPLRFQVIPSALISLGTVILIVTRPPLDNLTTQVVLVAAVLANVIGAYTSRQLHIWRRRQFAARMKETALRIRLERAMEDIKTLQGVIPICSHCKRVRREIEDWQQIEEYVTAHTNAEFSHGICPQCMYSHFGLKPAQPE